MSASRDLVYVDDEYYIHATSSRVDDRKRVLKQGDSFAVFDRLGDIHPYGHGGHGLYYSDTRFLSRLELSIGGRRPLLLNSGVTHDTAIFAVDLANVDLYDGDRLATPSGEIHVFRGTLLWERQCFQQIRVTNFGQDEVRLPIAIEFAADYADIFEVRGLARARRGRTLPADVGVQEVVLAYEGVDGVLRRTRLHSTLRPSVISADRMGFDVTLSPGAEVTLALTISCEVGPAKLEPRVTYEQAERQNRKSLETIASDECRIETGNEQFNDWLCRSLADLR